VRPLHVGRLAEPLAAGDLLPREFEPKRADVHLDVEAPLKPGASGNYPLPVPGITKLL
jgi:hypothetical protein